MVYFLQLTWVDFFFACVIETINNYVKEDLLKNRPNLQSVVSNVVDLEVIAEWIKTRPESAM